MRNLFLLLVRNGGLLIFLILETISLVLAVQYNDNRGKIFFSSFNNGVAYTDSKIEGFFDYFQLEEYADSIATENARLRAQQDNMFYIHLIEQDSLKSEEWEQQFLVTNAKVVDNSINRQNNQIIIDRGSKHGIKPHSGVMDNGGLVGVIVEVRSRFSRVMSMLHKESKISAAIRGTNDIGSLVWDGRDSKILSLEDVPKHASITKGAIVETSGYSQMFPRGIQIGTIDTFWIDGGSNFFNIQVRLTNDLGKAKHVYVIENTFRDEIEQLKQGQKDNE